ncbi:MAG: hypothetical protein R3B97_07925 [Dehalococcoidia bacterium]|nr:hypothetical protein [Dehalococcoidia bacterium]MCB9486633.1 hypothetical protein [Thermoflexaceae bacterium]
MPAFTRTTNSILLGVIVALVAGAVGSWALAGLSAEAKDSPPASLVPSAADAAHQLDPATSEQQRAALADGVVTREEYEQAVEATAQCLESAGAGANVVAIREPGRGPGGTTRLSWQSSVSTQSNAGLQGDLLGCFTRHKSAVERVWGIQLITPEAVEAMWQAMDSCLDAAGFPELKRRIAWDIQEQYGPESAEVRAHAQCGLKHGELAAP